MCVSWWGPKGGAPKGGGAQNFALFSLSHTHFRSFSLSLGVFSWNFGGVFEDGPLNVRVLEFSGCRVKPRREHLRTPRNVVLESTQETFCDGVVSGPTTALTVCRKMLHNGNDPKRWFAEWAKELSIGRKDRAWRTLIDIFLQAGCYDQLNIGALACMELSVVVYNSIPRHMLAQRKTLPWQHLFS